MSKLNGASIVIETLIEQGTKVVFGYPGGQVLNIYAALYLNSDRIKHVITAHEQGASHAADGYARASGNVGVVIATSGPGATNLVTGIANAYLDSVPLIAITGNVPCELIGRDSFQEVDITGITNPIVKHNFIVKDVNELADTIREAFYIAQSGRPGPVLVDIPKDIQVAEAEFEPKPPVTPKKSFEINEDEVSKAVEMINSAKRPYIYCGGGVISSDASDEVAALAELVDAPIGFSMMGLSAVGHSNPRALGMIGMHGRYTATKAKCEADLIIALGVRFSDRATGKKSAYMPNAKIIHIDVDAAEIDKNIPVHLGIVGNVKDVVAKINSKLTKAAHPEWHEKIAEIENYEAANVPPIAGTFSPHAIVETVNAYCSPETPVATDVGQHQMWVAQKYKFEKPRKFITSGGLGTMGFGFGGAIGACMATGERTVMFTGDGSFGMNLNELTTAVSQNLPITIVVMNNGVLGMVRQWQTLFYDKHYSETTLNRKTDFVAVAKAFGADGTRVTNTSELEEALKTANAQNGTYLIDCMIDMDERVLPMIPPNKSVEELIIK